jgi:hypothetical protein
MASTDTHHFLNLNAGVRKRDAQARQRRQPSPALASHWYRQAAATALFAFSFALAGGARADVVKRFTWTFGAYTATGTLSVADTPTFDSFRRITSLTGVMNGEAMSLLPPDSFPGSAPGDNLIDIDATELTYNGLAWAAGDTWWNLYRDTTQFSACSGSPSRHPGCVSFYDVSTFVLDEAPMAVPTPATLPLVALGGLALWTTRRPRRARQLKT